MLFLLFVGQLVGPALAGLLGASYRLEPAFYLSAVLVALIAFLARRESAEVGPLRVGT